LRLVPVAINLSALPAGELIGASVSSEGANHVLGVAVDPPSPSIAPLSATNITVNSATLKSTVNPNSNSTSASFQYGLDTSYGSTTPPQDVGSGVSLVMLSAPISDLTPHTTYHFRAVADNAAGNGGGADATFMTQDTFPVANADRVDHVAGPVIISVRANDTDADGDSLSITGITQGTSGSVSTDGNTVTYNPGASFSSSDTFTYTISDGFGGTAVGTVTVNAAPLQSWRVQTFGTNAGDSSVAGDNADPNQNGIPNLMEYALHGDALGNGTGAAILPQASKDVSQHLQLVFTRYADRNDVTLTVQGADSPGGPWTDLAQSVNGGVFSAIAGGATVSENSGSGGFAVTVGDIYATTDPAHPRRFMRLQVTRP
jgi:hypothetical protein